MNRRVASATVAVVVVLLSGCADGTAFTSASSASSPSTPSSPAAPESSESTRSTDLPVATDGPVAPVESLPPLDFGDSGEEAANVSPEEVLGIYTEAMFTMWDETHPADRDLMCEYWTTENEEFIAGYMSTGVFDPFIELGVSEDDLLTMTTIFFDDHCKAIV